MRMRLFVALALVVAVAADPAAPHTLQEMVDSIKSGKFQNNVLPLLRISSTHSLMYVHSFLGRKWSLQQTRRRKWVVAYWIRRAASPPAAALVSVSRPLFTIY